MHRLPSFRRLLAPLPLRWRLALVSLGLLATLLISLGILISASEEQTLLTNQAHALGAEASLVQEAGQGSTTPFTTVQIQAFPTMSDELASSLVSDTQRVLGRNVGVSILSLAARAQPGFASAGRNGARQCADCGGRALPASDRTRRPR